MKVVFFEIKRYFFLVAMRVSKDLEHFSFEKFHLSFGEGETECVSNSGILKLFPLFPRRLGLFGVSTFC